MNITESWIGLHHKTSSTKKTSKNRRPRFLSTQCFLIKSLDELNDTLVNISAPQSIQSTYKKVHTKIALYSKSN